MVAAVFSETADVVDFIVFHCADVYSWIFVGSPRMGVGSDFYWALYRPYSFSVVSAFLTGLALDLLESTPLGVNTLTFTVLYIVTETQRRFLIGKTFSLVWAGFAILAFGAYFLNGSLFRCVWQSLHR